MASPDWMVPPAVRPKPEDYGFDLDRALAAMVGLHAIVPEDAFTAQTLGTHRAGHGVLIGNGVVLTIGYLVTEAETIWISLSTGGAVQGHLLGYDFESGFGLVQPLARLELPTLPLGRSRDAKIGDRVVIGAAGGRQRSVGARILAKQEFAGYWEYVLDEALFVAPAHPNWGGTALIGQGGELLGIGSLQLQQGREGAAEHLNMVVPIDLLKPIYDDMLTMGRPNRPARPWLGLYATEIDEQVVIVSLADNGPAQRADLRPGDIVLSVAGTRVKGLAALFRKVWSLGEAGVRVPLAIRRDGVPLEIGVTSSDRSRFYRRPQLH